MGSADQSALAIVVVLYNSRDEVESLWHCLAAQDWRNWRLLVIDNSSGDGAGRYLAERGDARVTVLANTRNEGFAKAVNAGLGRAIADGAQRCLLLNPDVEFHPGFLADLVARWNETGAQVISPRIMLSGRPDHAWYAGGGFDRTWLFTNVHYPYRPDGDAPRLVEFASGCCLGLDVTVLRRVGLLDESFFVYWEDSDLCLRLQQEGIPIHYVPSVTLLHAAGASTGGERSPAAQRLFHQSYVVMMRKHFGFVAALRTIWRSLAQEWRHRKREPGRWIQIAMAMTSGLLRRRRPVPAVPRDATG